MLLPLFAPPPLFLIFTHSSFYQFFFMVSWIPSWSLSLSLWPSSISFSSILLFPSQSISVSFPLHPPLSHCHPHSLPPLSCEEVEEAGSCVWWTSPACRHLPAGDLISGRAWQSWVAACFFWLHVSPLVVSGALSLSVCVCERHTFENRPVW